MSGLNSLWTRPETDRVCATVLKKQYFLKDYEIDHIECEVARNPHRRSMHMYLFTIADVRMYIEKCIGQSVLFQREKESVERKAKKQKCSELIRELGYIVEKGIVKAVPGTPFVELGKAVRQFKKEPSEDRKAGVFRLLETVETWTKEREFVVGINFTLLPYESYVAYVTGRRDAGDIQNEYSYYKGREDRRAELKAALAVHGLPLRTDSSLCNAYINNNDGYIEEIVNTMREMDFFFTKTDYSQRMRSKMSGLCREEREMMRPLFSESAKKEALDCWYKKNPAFDLNTLCPSILHRLSSTHSEGRRSGPRRG